MARQFGENRGSRRLTIVEEKAGEERCAVDTR
jgi:hypothetical protein